MAKHTVLGGKVHVYQRPNSRFWQCSAYLAGKNRRESTGKESLAEAEDFAEDWYLNLRGKLKSGQLKSGKLFEDVAKVFEREFEVITGGQRSPAYIQNLKNCIRVHLMPFFQGMVMAEITEAKGIEYRMHRIETSPPGKPPSRTTIQHEFVALNHILRTARRHGWLSIMPDLSPPYKASGKVGHRAWFNPEEYRQLYTATRARAQNPRKERWRWECEQLHDFVLMMGNTGLRPDEAWQLQYRDVKIVDDQSTNETILEIEVRGKRGFGLCKSMPGAVRPFQRLKTRNDPLPTDLLFPGRHHELFNAILTEEGLKFDRDGHRRTAYSLRHTYICLRLMEGADIYQVAKNCRTSVEMIQKHYAVHLKHTLDAASLNVRKSPTRDQIKPKLSKRPRSDLQKSEQVL